MKSGGKRVMHPTFEPSDKTTMAVIGAEPFIPVLLHRT